VTGLSAAGGRRARALLFDLDGCLVDSLPSIRHCWERTLAAFDAPAPPGLDRMRRLAGPPVDEVARALLPDADPATIAAVVAHYRRCSRASVEMVPAFGGVVELLGELSERGVVLAIATSKSIEVAEPVLEHLDLRRFFTAVEGTRVDEAGTAKAIVVRRVMARLPIAPAGLIGDREHDIIGAHANRIDGYGALWGYAAPGELEAAGADALLAAPADVATLVG
jgi:phosphoglycolate phosphatase